MNKSEGFKECEDFYNTFSQRSDAGSEKWWTELVEEASEIGTKYGTPVTCVIMALITYMERELK